MQISIAFQFATNPFVISLRQKSALQAFHSPQPVVAVLVADEAFNILGAGLDRKRMANVQLRAVFIDDLVELGVDLLTCFGIAQTAALLDQFVCLGIVEEGAVAGLALLCFGQKPDRMNVTIKDAAAVGAVRAASAKGGMPYG